MVIDERLNVFIDSLSWDIPGYLEDTWRAAVEAEVPVIRRSMQTLLGFLIRTVKPSRILEIGTASGFSSLLISEYAGEDTIIDTIEKVPARIAAAEDNFKKYGREGKINLIKGDACQVLDLLADKGKRYDFVFMDAAKGQYMNFLMPVCRLLDNGGMLVTDNVLQDGDILQSRYAVTRRDRTIHKRMREFLYYLTHSGDFDTVILPVGDGVTVSVKNCNGTGKC